MDCTFYCSLHLTGHQVVFRPHDGNTGRHGWSGLAVGASNTSTSAVGNVGYITWRGEALARAVPAGENLHMLTVLWTLGTHRLDAGR
jgi:hypothetical protein